MISRRRFLHGLGLAPLALSDGLFAPSPGQALGPRTNDTRTLLYLERRPLDLTRYAPDLADPEPVRAWARATVGSHLSTLHEPGLPRLGIVRFSWFGVANRRQTGQLPGPWIPDDAILQTGGSGQRRIPAGMLAWTGSVAYHERHLRSLIAHGFDLLVLQHSYGWRRTQRTQVRALSKLKRQGPIPTVAPFLEAASYRDYGVHKDFNQPQIRDTLFKKLSRFFDLHFTFLGPEDLTWKDGRVLVYLWWIPGARNAPAGLLDELNARLHERYGFDVYWSAHEYWAQTRPDTFDRLFNGVQSFRRDTDGNMSVMPGFFPPSAQAVQEGLFLPRNGAQAYWGAWNQVIDDVRRTRRAPAEVIVESHNEVAEGTAIAPMIEPERVYSVEGRDEEACTRNACRVPGAEGLQDRLSENPLEYLQISKVRKQELLDVARSL